MPRIVASRTLLGLALLLSASPAEAERIQIRASSMLPKSVQDVLNKIGAITEVTLPQGFSVEELLRSRCGSFSESYLEEFKRLNDPATAPMAARPGRKLSLPPCPKVQRLVLEIVAPGDTLDSVLLRATGADAASRVMRCRPEPATTERCEWQSVRDIVADLNGGASAQLHSLTPGRVLTLPYRTGPTVLTLATGWSMAEARAKLLEAAANTPAGTALLSIGEEPGFSPFAAIDDGHDLLAAAGCNKLGSISGNWPFNQQRVRKAILDGLAHLAAAVPPRTPARTTVRVADNGFAGVGHPDGFPMQFLQFNPRETDPATDYNKNKFFGDQFGINADFRGDIAPIHSLDASWHGTEVAHLVLGGRAFRADTPQLAQLIGLNFARMYPVTGGTPQPSMLLEALRAIIPPAPHIVNISMGGPRPIHGTSDMASNLISSRQLLVIAAGNESTNIFTKAIYPASETAINPAIRHAVIVVGAHGPTEEPTLFTNYGAGVVDLLAPGCALPRSDDKQSGLHGTSFSAPLVTFTAAIVRGLLEEAEPARVRERLRLTARSLLGGTPKSVSFQGTLDIESAIRVFDDIVRLQSGEIVYGLWTKTADDEVSLCGVPPIEAAGEDNENPPQPRDARRVGRVSVVAPNLVPPRLSIIDRNFNGGAAEREVFCRAASVMGPALLLPDGSRRDFRWSEIAAFIPAFDIVDRRALPEGSGVGTKAPPTLPSSQLEAVQRLQEALAKRNLYDGKIDGIAGPATAAAIRSFQVGRNEAPTGLLSPTQRRTLAVEQ